VNPVRSGRKQR